MSKKRNIAALAGKAAPVFFGRKLKNPVFIIGSGRGGTSMLAALLNAHQSIVAFPNEANDLWHPALYPYHENNINVPPIWIEPYEFTDKSLSLWNVNWGKKIRGVFGAYQMLLNKPVFLNKSVMINFMLEKLLIDFPDAKFIYVVRNGLSVALSYQKKEVEKYKLPRYEKYNQIVSDVKLIRLQHAKYWNETVMQIERDRKKLFSKKDFYELKYENLVEQPFEEVEKLLQFINLPMDRSESFIQKLTAVNNRNYKVTEELDATERNELQTAMQEGLRLKGYIV